MPNRNKHKDFDEFLIKKGIISDDQYDHVHDFMDWNVLPGMTHGLTHTEEVIRLYFGTEYEDIDFEQAKDFLRAALGHLCLDGFEKYLIKKPVKGEGWVYKHKGILDLVYDSMVQRGWTTAIPITVAVNSKGIKGQVIDW